MMADPIPIYPQVEARPEADIDIGNSTDSTPKSKPVSLFDRTFFQGGVSLRQVRDSALTALSRIKRTAIYVAQERPIHLVLGVAIAAFAAGAGLRTWRSHHE
jgi:hypothetical protein